MTVNGHRIRSIDSYDARKLPDGSVILYARAHFDYKTGKPIGATYYRCVIGSKMVAAGLEKFVRSEPDADWPEIPPWATGWMWLEENSVTGFCVIVD